jgi:hypothetical protein
MTLCMRKLFLGSLIVSIFLLANALTIAGVCDRLGVVALAQWLRDNFVTGTAVTVIIALLILLPTQVAWRPPWSIQPPRCPVCDEALRRVGRYCPACGSRV